MSCPGFGLNMYQAPDRCAQRDQNAVHGDLRHNIRTDKGSFDPHDRKREILIKVTQKVRMIEMEARVSIVLVGVIVKVPTGIATMTVISAVLVQKPVSTTHPTMSCDPTYP